MIEFEEAKRIVTDSTFETAVEVVAFDGSSGRVLAENVLSDIDMPPFNRSAVDGYACRREDLDSALELVETISAGKMPELPVGKKQCSKIMTGGVVPAECNMVFMIEDAESLPSGRVLCRGSSVKNNISLRGEDIRVGDQVLAAGKLIKPQDIALMAAAGCTRILVRKRPSLAIISSGNELVEPARKPAPGQIRDSNSYQLVAQAERAGAIPAFYGIACDDEEETYKIVEKAISENDIVIITGGVSMGDFDFVPSVMERAGVRILFTRIAVQPGKPTTFGVHPGSLVFGLPGNPVSSFMQFELLVRPTILRMMGCHSGLTNIALPIAENYQRKSADRMAWVPVVINTAGAVIPVEFHGSAHIASLTDADGIMQVPVGKLSLNKGEIVNVRQI